MRSINDFIEPFIPANVRKNPADLMRAYILVSVVFVNIFTAILSVIGIYTVLNLPTESKTAIGISLALLFLGYFATLEIFRRSGRYRLAGNILICSIMIVVSVPVCLSGGFHVSPIVPVLSIIPVMGFLLTGLRGGLRWLLVTVILCVLLFLLSDYGLISTQMIPDARARELMRLGLQIIFILSNSAALLVYEIMNERLKMQLNAERNEFEKRASHDSLTGIANRFEFFRRLHSGMVECKDRKLKLAVLYIDLNGFKPINDQHGHQAGDKVLQVVAKRLQTVLRLSDTAARLGGDEFGLVLPGIHVPENLQRIREKVNKAINEPIDIGNTQVTVTASTGEAIFPDHATEMNLLCSHADKAMYGEKAGRISRSNPR